MRKSLKRWLIPMSAAMITLLSAGTVLAADTVNVKVENTRGGYVSVYYYDEYSRPQYLPIGETVQVPEGTELRYNARALNYFPNGANYYQGIVYDVEKLVGSESFQPEVEKYYNNQERGTVLADENMAIKATFKAYEKVKASEEYDPRYFIGFKVEDDYVDSEFDRLSAGAFSEQLYLWDEENEKVYPYNSGVKVEIDSVSYEDIYEDTKDVPDDLFYVDKNGKLTASKALEKGQYYIDGFFTYEDDRKDFSLCVNLGAKLQVTMPMGFYKTSENQSDYSLWANWITEYFIEEPAKTTFNDEAAKLKNYRTKLVGHELTGLAELNGKTFKNVGTSKISSRISEKDPIADVYALYNNYTVPTIDHLTKDDVIPKIKNAGWNKIDGKWYYYNTTDVNSLVKNQWLSCPDNDNESVWVGADGTITTAGIVTDGDTKYLVGAKGHKMRSQTGFKYNGFEYTTDAEGVITEVKLDQAAAPGNADETKDFVDKVTDNMDDLSADDKKAAADMTTAALKKNVDTSKLTKEETKKYADVYRNAYGAGNITISGSDDADAMIVAAGLTSKDFENGSVTIEMAGNWLATSSNAVKVELTLYVNGAKRTLTAPVKVEVELPEAFVASYSNASYNFSVSPKPVSYEIKDGKMIITIAKADVYTVQATKKSSGSSGSHRGSSGGSGRATVKAEYKVSDGKTGNWIFDNKGWWFKYQDGTWPKSQWIELEWNNVKSWYYFGADGYMTTGWYQDGGKWYYLHPQADGTRGRMYTGWNQIGNNWYYFRVTAGGPKGSLVVNDTTPDGYKVNENGEWVK